MQSKKHKAAVKSGIRKRTTSEGDKTSSAASSDPVEMDLGRDLVASASGDTKTPPASAAQEQNETAEDGVAGAEAGEQPAGEDEMPEPVLRPTQCLFCKFEAPTFEGLVSHLTEAHNFHIPDLTYLSDLEGLITYLQLKVGNFYECIKCGKGFHGLEAARKHMLDKGHTQARHCL